MEVFKCSEIEKPNFISDVVKKQRKSINALTIEGMGDPLLTFDNKILIIKEYLKSKCIKPNGHTFGVYYLNRNDVGVNNVKWDACVPISNNKIKLSNEIKLKEFPKSNVLSTTLTGDYDLIGSALEYLNSVAKTNNITTKLPLTEIYINEGEEPITELQLIVR